MAATVVKVKQETHARLQEIAKEQQRSMGDVVTELVERYEKEQFWKQVNEAVERLREDPVAWQDYQDEIAFFEGGSMDGLENEEPYYTPEEEEAIRAEAARTESR
jgi:predicted DNA-binding protein